MMVQELQGAMTSFVRDAGREVSQDELIDAFPKHTVAQVRLIAADLRKRNVFAARVEHGKVYYSWITKREVEEPPLRIPESQVRRSPATANIGAFPRATPPSQPTTTPKASAPMADRILAVMKTKPPQHRWQFKELLSEVGALRDAFRKTLSTLIGKGLYAQGHTNQRRYSLTPFTDVTRVDLKDVPAEQIRELSPEAQKLTEESAELACRSAPAVPDLQQQLPEIEVLPPSSPAAPRRRFCVYNDGSLGIECERCNGELSREDLVALRDFVNRIPELADG